MNCPTDYTYVDIDNKTAQGTYCKSSNFLTGDVCYPASYDKASDPCLNSNFIKRNGELCCATPTGMVRSPARDELCKQYDVKTLKEEIKADGADEG